MNEDKERILLDQRYVSVFNTISDESLGALALALEDDLRDAFARITGLSADTFADTASLGGKVRDGIARRRAAHDAGVVLSEPCTQFCIEDMGDASEDPTIEDLHACIPKAIEKFGLDAARLMAVQYSKSLKGFRQLIAEDERFAIPVVNTLPGVREIDEEAQAAKRAARKARKEKEKASKAKQPGKK